MSQFQIKKFKGLGLFIIGVTGLVVLSFVLGKFLFNPTQALAATSYKIGDKVTDHIGSIIIEKILFMVKNQESLIQNRQYPF